MRPTYTVLPTTNVHHTSKIRRNAHNQSNKFYASGGLSGRGRSDYLEKCSILSSLEVFVQV
ncbi:hypothetical protein QJS10_CPA05g01003 [Acorus calamus]|uniref:Uncharacterized protein n=1 Tax=Acorus calamus TaxID=4465 RepID=A0AAV9ET64_ACOCL|nr:hypothetical protein QJS10_CPA05g01003 [Acorus calamus]